VEERVSYEALMIAVDEVAFQYARGPAVRRTGLYVQYIV
jgi:hypothetical protein